jgi:hypothetical protein
MHVTPKPALMHRCWRPTSTYQQFVRVHNLAHNGNTSRRFYILKTHPFWEVIAASNTLNTPKVTATNCMRPLASWAWGGFQRNWTRFSAQAGRKVGSKLKIQIRPLQLGLRMGRFNS